MIALIQTMIASKQLTGCIREHRTSPYITIVRLQNIQKNIKQTQETNVPIASCHMQAQPNTIQDKPPAH